jgi:hypothetical protein
MRFFCGRKNGKNERKEKNLLFFKLTKKFDFSIFS